MPKKQNTQPFIMQEGDFEVSVYCNNKTATEMYFGVYFSNSKFKAFNISIGAVTGYYFILLLNYLHVLKYRNLNSIEHLYILNPPGNTLRAGLNSK